MTALLLLAAHLALPVPSPRSRLLQPPTRARRVLLPLLGIGGVVFLLVGTATTALAAGAVALTAVRVLHDARHRAHLRRREEHAARLLGLLHGELRAGQTMAAAVDHAAAHLPADTPAALTATLAGVSTQVHRGLSGAAVLRDGPPELAPLGVLWELSERHGLPLAPLVAQAQHRIDARLRHRAATTATLQGPQATAVILTLLPLAGVVMGTAMGADPVAFLTGGGLGGALLVAGTGLAAGGFL